MNLKFNRLALSKFLRDWGVLVFSVATFTPLLVTYLAGSGTRITETQNQPQQNSPRKEAVLPDKNPSLSPPIPITEAKDKGRSQMAALIPTKTKSAPASLTSVKTTTKNTAPPTPVKTAPKPRTHGQKMAVPVGYTPPPLEIRVAIEQDINTASVGVSTPGSILDANGRVLQSIAPNEGVWLNPTAGGLSMGNTSLPQMIFIQPQNNGLVYVNDRWYRGKVLVISQGSSLLVVNYVNLEDYLYSVVGSEMHPTAPTEALKAQAIAARSYALVHIIRPASPWFNLGNTQRWQVYKGIQSEYNTGHHAVNETAGQILSYRGGVVESLYAATDEIVSWAHGGKGMSQTGAYDLANQGYDYQRILGYYYPEVSLARLVLQR
ncbi:MAG: hypothetical protein N5P05_000549 [Chroococcopsis gigantea SAG 12.99]|jgi:peptidoglycan hydrolase-like amidase|nr:SpoIID/LytB domain-containing protein [Chlorogloea purpurea SAG 13.99]MDV2998943.1 hypothetical protein [Chroococcopsis gigantea SAG 12.99]